MAIRSTSFDDDISEPLFVFSGNDLLIAHYDVADLDWQEVAERSALDERRGLAITQVGVIEDLIDEFILYLADTPNVAEYQAELDGITIGPRLDRLKKMLLEAELLDDVALEAIESVKKVVIRRNELAHGTIYCRPVQPVKPGSWAHGIELEWVITSRRSRDVQRSTMAGLRQDVEDAVGSFMLMLQLAERLVERSCRPHNFQGGQYLGAPTE